MAITLHWVIALGIIILVTMGLVMVHVDLASAKLFQLYQLHKSIGITVLILAVLRVVWRLTHRPPPLKIEMPVLERAAASSSHSLLYVLLLAQPITGWALVSASVLAIPTVLFGVIPWPDIPYFAALPNREAVGDVLKQVHAYGAYCFIAVVALHTAAALRHHFILRDDVLLRMLPGRADLNAAAPQIEEAP
ncbi:cytochrome b [Sphingomonas sp. PAMC 26617]|uniref:cytochrome b n=1 Tax=Sphingomonas sp. PAMC 26617 TaxID=1112216 RepID=UPI0018DED5E9|nr:cytochrome b [Sphingomonas sp. PAMC 26617]